VAFGPPRIGLGLGGASRWLHPQPAPQPQMQAPPPAALAQAAQEAMRRQVLAALQQRLSSMPQADDRRCAPHDGPEDDCERDSARVATGNAAPSADTGGH
jgi:hypothetical protein